MSMVAPAKLDSFAVKAAQHAVVVRCHDPHRSAPVLVDLDSVGDSVLVRRHTLTAWRETKSDAINSAIKSAI